MAAAVSEILAYQEDGFEVPAFNENVDLDAYVRRCPPGATTRGTFFQYVRDHVREKRGTDPEGLYEGMTTRRWVPFASYALADFMRLAYNAATLLHRSVPTSEGLRRIGWMSYPSFASTMAGRAVLFALGEGMEDISRMAPKAYAISLPGATVRSMPMAGGRRWRFELRDVYSFVDTYHYGVLEGAAIALGLRAELRMRRLERPCDADFVLGWQ